MKSHVRRTGLERDDAWEECEVKGDVGAFVMRHLESPYSVRAPLLVLGHPGSGKSILTEMLAGHLAYPGYTTIRVKLRDINPDMSLLRLLEDQVRNDTGGLSLPWADFANGLAMSPPVIILDGYDELLQATGKVFASYLEDVCQFQYGQALQRRPVRVIVTSRLTLIDKAIIPPGATVARLEDFDMERCAAWGDVWNRYNTAFFGHMGIRPFALPESEKLLHLAKQPLLLLMLAIYDSAANELSPKSGTDGPDIDQTVLYDKLLRRFIERELSKRDHGRWFRELSAAERADAVSQEMERLGVAAIGMFNRQEVKIRRDQLNDDLRYFEVEREAAQAGRALNQAELLLGSFFFVHESRSKLTENSADPAAAPSAFEFLHNTFGEFLAADFILHRAIEEAQTICELSLSRRLAETRNQRLAMMSEGWFGCLIHTPLHTRMNIVSMLREWSRHWFGDAHLSRSELLAALGEIVTAQLRAAMNDLTLPDPDPERRALSRYARLPKRGHLAIYSLNLVLLRTYIGDEQYILDEADLADQADGCRPWDSLVNLWRSWFPLQSLGVLAGSMTATRRDTLIAVDWGWSGWTPLGAQELATIFSVSVALADDVTAATTGLHIAPLHNLKDDKYQLIRQKVESEVPELIPAANLLAMKMCASKAFEIPTLDIPEGGRSGYKVDFSDMAERMTHSPRQWSQVRVTAEGMRSLIGLSRYQAEVVVAARAKIEPQWLPHRFAFEDDSETTSHEWELWPRFLQCPAAAPVLRAILREFDKSQFVLAAARIGFGRSGTLAVFDVDTAAALAVLLHRGLDEYGRDRSLELIVQECAREAWSLLDIPERTLDGLVDLFGSADQGITSLRAQFSQLFDRATKIVDGKDNIYDMQPFLITALRVGATSREDRIIDICSEGLVNIQDGWVAGRDRAWIMSLLGWLRETGGRRLGSQPLTNSLISWLTAFLAKAPEDWDPELISTARFGGSLSYKEADDLRWAIGALKGKAELSLEDSGPARAQQAKLTRLGGTPQPSKTWLGIGGLRRVPTRPWCPW